MINRQPKKTPWGGGTHFVTMLSDYLSAKNHQVYHNFVYNLDVILMIDPRPEDGINDINKIIGYKKLNTKTKLIHRINDSDIPRNTNFLDKMNIESNSAVADKTIFISNWLLNYYITKGFDSSKDHSVILNGCNLNNFDLLQNKEVNKKIKLITHHWSDNFNKGFDTYIAIDKFLQNKENSDKFEFTYIGRYNKEYHPINTKIITPLYGKELGEELSKHDVYVTAARYEACGMHHIEAAACGLPILYHGSGGGVVEMCQKYGEEFNNFNEFIMKFGKIISNYNDYKNKLSLHRESLSSDLMCQKYVDIIENIKK